MDERVDALACFVRFFHRAQAVPDSGADEHSGGEPDFTEADVASELERFGLVDGGPQGAAAHTLCDRATDKLLCRLYSMGNGASLKACCMLHTKCTVWVTCRPGLYSTVLIDLIDWAQSGRNLDGEGHGELGREVKRCHHMAPRK